MSRQKDLSINAKTTAFVILAVGVLVALMVAVQFRSSLNRVAQIENDQATEHAERVVRQLENTLIDIGGTNVDWAWWDDTFEFIQDGNEEYRDDNLYAEAFSPLGVDLVAFLDNDGSVVHQAWFVDDSEADVPTDLIALTEPGALLGDFGDDPNGTRGGIVEADGEIFLVSSRAILPSTMTGTSEGVLLMARHVTDDFTADFAELVNLDLLIEPCAENSCDGLTTEPRITKSDTTVTTTTVVSAVDGTAALRVRVDEARTMYQESRDGIQRVLLILIAVGIGAIVLTVVGLRILILDPLSRLGTTVSDVARKNDPSLRTPIDRQDEIGDLAAGVNIMLARLERSQNQLLEAKADVEGASEAKSRFLSRVSHELRTPINGVLAYAQLLELDGLEGESGEFVEQIITAARHITSLIDEFLDIARIEAGAIPITTDRVDPKSLASEVASMTSPLSAESGTAVEVFGPDDAAVLADPLRLRQSILNLVSNAIKYGRSDRPISVSIRSDGPRTSIEVRDEGPGIPADQVHRLFVPFDRLGADSSEEAGSGIGLAVTKQLVELMNGTIEVDSRLGHGTTFTISLPTAPTSSTTTDVTAALSSV